MKIFEILILWDYSTVILTRMLADEEFSEQGVDFSGLDQCRHQKSRSQKNTWSNEEKTKKIAHRFSPVFRVGGLAAWRLWSLGCVRSGMGHEGFINGTKLLRSDFMKK